MIRNAHSWVFTGLCLLLAFALNVPGVVAQGHGLVVDLQEARVGRRLAEPVR